MPARIRPARSPARPEPPGKTRFFGSKRLQADRYASDFKKLADEVLGPLGATPGVTLNVTIEIEATAPDGFDDAKVRTVSENAATLKFEQSGFEEAWRRIPRSPEQPDVCTDTRLSRHQLGATLAVGPPDFMNIRSGVHDGPVVIAAGPGPGTR